MMRVPASLVVVASLSAALPASQGRPPSAAIDFVEIDAAVVDGKGRTIRGLAQGDFSIREDGKAVAISTFSEVSGPVENDPDSARTVVLMLDDTGVSPTGTPSVQAIARAFVSSAAVFDDMPVVRLHVPADEPFGDRIAGEARIEAYRGGAWPFAYWSTAGEVLERVAGISRLVAANTSKRKVIVCVGSPYVCNVQEPLSSDPRPFVNGWASAISEAATANVAMYALIPGRAPLSSGGLPEYTGGEVLASTYDVGPAIDHILQDAANFYVLGYWPVSAPPALHRVDVKVNRRGAKVHARRLR